MAIEDDIRMLGGVRLFANLSDAQLKIVAFSGEHVDFQQGQFLYRKGDKSTATFVILNGNAEIVLNADKNNSENILVEPGSFAGEVGMLTNTDREVSLRAVDDVRTLRISRELLLRLANDFPEIGIEMMAILESRLNETLSDLGVLQGDLNFN